VHSIAFLQNYSGILGVAKVMSDISAIVLAICLLLNWYSCLLLITDDSHERYMTVSTGSPVVDGLSGCRGAGPIRNTCRVGKLTVTFAGSTKMLSEQNVYKA